MAQRNRISTTVWERLEPHSKNPEMSGTVRMELADPLWLLARQRQFGEFAGEDAGSPVRVRVRYSHDRLSAVEVGDTIHRYAHDLDGNGIPQTEAELPPPLEALIEREPVAAQATTGPSTRVRAETGMHFLVRLHDGLLDLEGSVTLPSPADFPPEFWLARPEVADAAGRRFYDVMGTAPNGREGSATRALDGHTIYAALTALVPHIADAEPTEWPSALPDERTFPLPANLDFASNEFREAAESFVRWYANLYDEPAPDEDAWDAERMEYSARVATGAGHDETIFEVQEYHGGHLDWHDFNVAEGATLQTEEFHEGRTETKEQFLLPTRAAFRGMPALRLWELEDASVNLSAISAAGDDLSRLFLLEFALIAGNDWFVLPLEAPVGSLTRLKSLKVLDTFSNDFEEIPQIKPAVLDTENVPQWTMFTFDLPSQDEPGLFLPPVLGSTLHSDSVEEVLFGRDEMANLLFGIETAFEGPLGDPIDRTQFSLPDLVILDIHPADHPDEEYVALHNEGDDELNLEGWQVRVPEQPIYIFGEVTLAARATLRVHVGGDEILDRETDLHAGLDETILASDVSVTVLNNKGALVVTKPVTPNTVPGIPRYRLVSKVADHWFPYIVERAEDRSTHRFKPALLLDADALSGSIKAIPRPLGTVLDPMANIYEEEITRSGLEVLRRYQMASWIDGKTRVWSGRRVRSGQGEVSSGLRFDILEVLQEE